MSILSARGVILYQCARLLDTEVDDIKVNGLRATSVSLLADKLVTARREGLLTADQAELILSTGVLSNKHQSNARTNEICALTSLQIFRDSPGGVDPFLRNWGGEIIYFWQLADNANVLGGVLSSIGAPALVEFVRRPGEADTFFPDLVNVVIGRWRGLDDYGGEAHLRIPEGARVPVLDVWRSDDARWPT